MRAAAIAATSCDRDLALTAPPLHGYSIVIPSYRRGPLIEKTLQSATNQVVQPDEIIVVNDGGFDETAHFVQSRFPAVRLINIPHGGAAAARNAGVEACRSDYVLLIDDDDTLRPEGAGALLEARDCFPECHSIHGDNSYTHLGTGLHYERNYRDVPILRDRLARIPTVAVKGDVRLYGRAMYYELLNGNLLQQPWMCRRSSYLSLGGFQAGLVSADDWDIYMRFARRYPVAVTMALIGHQFTEPGRPHLTLDPRQREGQMEAARRHLTLAGWRDARASIRLRQILALHHKALADERRATAPLESWKQNVRSMYYWPFDTVVAARALGIQPAGLIADRLIRRR